MNEWISKQGLIFQLTHGGTGLGNRAPIIGVLLRSFASLAILALIAALSFGSYLIWKATGDQLPAEFKKSLARGLAVEEVFTSQFERDFSSGSYKSIRAKGNEATFFTLIGAREVSFPMSLRSGLYGSWDAETLRMRELNLGIKAGEADSESAQQSWQSLFRTSPDFTFSKLEVASTNFTWGYSSPATWGSIFGSRLEARRTADSWTLNFRGGTFSHGMFREALIEKLTVELQRDGRLEVTEAQMKQGEGTLQWTAEMVEGGPTPRFVVQGSFTNSPLAAWLPPSLLTVVNGNFSGEFTGTGSTNSVEGITFEGTLRPEGEEGLFLTYEVPLLRMLSHLDPQRSYRKFPFTKGRLRFKTSGTRLEFSDIDLVLPGQNLSEPSQATLTGSFVARPATPEDLARTNSSNENQNPSATVGLATTQPPQQQNSDFESKVLRLFPRHQFASLPLELSFVTEDRAGEEAGTPTIQLIPRRKFRTPSYLTGELSLSVPRSAFDKLAFALPNVQASSEESPLARIEIPVEGLVLETTRDLIEQWEVRMQEGTSEN